jgi:hypothetical protein
VKWRAVVGDGEAGTTSHRPVTQRVASYTSSTRAIGALSP